MIIGSANSSVRSRTESEKLGRDGDSGKGEGEGEEDLFEEKSKLRIPFLGMADEFDAF